MFKSKHMMLVNRPIIAIDYKYDYHNVIYFVATDEAGSTKYFLPYLFKYPDQFDNVSI